jgi:hypothetical protein
VPAQAVECAHRGLGVRHPDVDMDRRGRGAAQQPADLLVEQPVARRREVLHVEQPAVGMDACAEHRPARGEHASTQRAQGLGGGRAPAAYRRRQLDHRRVGVGLGPALPVGDVQAGEQVDRARRQGERRPVDEQQLVLDADAERGSGAEPRRGEVGGRHARPAPKRARNGRPRP